MVALTGVRGTAGVGLLLEMNFLSEIHWFPSASPSCVYQEPSLCY